VAVLLVPGAGALGAVLASIIGYGAAVWLASATIARRYSIEALQAGDFSSRPKLAVEGASIVFDNPVIGASLGGFNPLSDYASGIDHAHSYLLSIAADGACWSSASRPRPLSVSGAAAGRGPGDLRRSAGACWLPST
jgi:hypothetical protein